MIGPCGSGKTHLAVAALVEIINSGKPGRVLFSNFQDLIQEIQASFDSDEVPSKSELLRPLLEADLLVLDELGSQKPTTFVQDILYYVINTPLQRGADDDLHDELHRQPGREGRAARGEDRDAAAQPALRDGDARAVHGSAGSSAERDLSACRHRP